MDKQWFRLMLLAALSCAAVGSTTPAQADARVEMGRIAQQRSGAMDRREPTRAPQAQRVDNRRNNDRRVEVQQAQQAPQRAGKADKRRRAP